MAMKNKFTDKSRLSSRIRDGRSVEEACRRTEQFLFSGLLRQINSWGSYVLGVTRTIRYQLSTVNFQCH